MAESGEAMVNVTVEPVTIDPAGRYLLLFHATRRLEQCCLQAVRKQSKELEQRIAEWLAGDEQFLSIVVEEGLRLEIERVQLPLAREG